MLLEILGMDEARFITIYVVQGFLGALFLFLAFQILKRDRKRLNLIFSGFYASIAIGIFVNFIYAPLTDPIIVFVLYQITIDFIYTGIIYLVVFNIILLKSEKVITSGKQMLIIIGFCVLIICNVFIPGGVIINASTDWKPVYSIALCIYLLAVLSVFGTGTSLYFAYKIYQKFEDETLRKKWKFFVIGVIFVYSFTYGIIISNTLNIQAFRNAMGLIGFLLSVSGGLMMYYGVGRQLQK